MVSIVLDNGAQESRRLRYVDDNLMITLMMVLMIVCYQKNKRFRYV